MQRERLKESSSSGGAYFESSSHATFSSGCVLLDCVLGGGYAEGRVVNIVGDRSTGKTLLAIEACANFALRYPKGKVRYGEAESAFDVPYAERLGLPTERVTFADTLETVEDFFEDLERFAASVKRDGLYILDSLDALSDREEMKRGIAEGTYGTGKAKQMSQVFRRLIRKLGERNITLLIISQVRDKIGVTFGERTTRSGGRALDFYASQIIYLTQLKTLIRTIKGVKRQTGIVVRAKCKKNKVGLPFREVEFPILFYYGIDDLDASLRWLHETKQLKRVGHGSTVEECYEAVCGSVAAEQQLREVVRQAWQELDATFMPTRRKYV